MDRNICKDEEAYLELVKQELDDTLAKLCDVADTKKKEIIEMQRYVVKNHTDMDAMEIFTNQKMIANDTTNLENRLKVFDRLVRMKDNTYFGRIDFAFEGDDEEESEAFYIGIGDLTSERLKETLVYDWRAPISSMYYDYEIGPASYMAPVGRISGEILHKNSIR